MPRRPLIALALAGLALAAGAAEARTSPVLPGSYAGRASSTHDPVFVRPDVRRGHVRFTYKCAQTKDVYAYTGRLRGRSFRLTYHPAGMPRLLVVDIRGRFSGRTVTGTIRQDVCAGAVERFTARLPRRR